MQKTERWAATIAISQSAIACRWRSVPRSSAQREAD